MLTKSKYSTSLPLFSAGSFNDVALARGSPADIEGLPRGGQRLAPRTFRGAGRMTSRGKPPLRARRGSELSAGAALADAAAAVSRSEVGAASAACTVIAAMPKPADGLVVVWSDGVRGLWARRLDGAGLPLGMPLALGPALRAKGIREISHLSAVVLSDGSVVIGVLVKCQVAGGASDGGRAPLFLRLTRAKDGGLLLGQPGGIVNLTTAAQAPRTGMWSPAVVPDPPVLASLGTRAIARIAGTDPDTVNTVELLPTGHQGLEARIAAWPDLGLLGPVVPGNGFVATSHAPDGADPAAFFLDRVAGRGLVLRWFTRIGQEWRLPAVPVPGSRRAVNPSLCCMPDGMLVIIWQDGLGGLIRAMVVALPEDPDTGFQPVFGPSAPLDTPEPGMDTATTVAVLGPGRIAVGWHVALPDRTVQAVVIQCAVDAGRLGLDKLRSPRPLPFPGGDQAVALALAASPGAGLIAAGYRVDHSVPTILRDGLGPPPHERPDCLVAGTRVRTPTGDVAVEELKPGDLVVTSDGEVLPLRWRGTWAGNAQGEWAPVHFEPGTIGNTRALRVSPAHRVMIGGRQAQLLAGVPEVLVPARDLVNGTTIRRVEGGAVVYHHLLLDRHAIILAEASPVESFYLGQSSWSRLDDAARHEILRLLPKLARDGIGAYGPPARPHLREPAVRAVDRAAIVRARPSLPEPPVQAEPFEARGTVRMTRLRLDRHVFRPGHGWGRIESPDARVFPQHSLPALEFRGEGKTRSSEGQGE